MRILVADDDKQILNFISTGLRQEGYVVTEVPDGEEAITQLTCQTFDAAVLDITMPKVDGLTVIQRCRSEQVKTPILILSAKHSVDDRVTGLRAGGDDYMVKPFAFSELLARIESLIRRVTGRAERTVFEVGDLKLDVLKHEVHRAGKRIELQQREFALLLYLMRNEGRICSKSMILDQVWGYCFDTQTNVLESRMSRLRTKIDKDFATPYVHTIRGVGYAIRADN